jgi:hypothetical protein
MTNTKINLKFNLNKAIGLFVTVLLFFASIGVPALAETSTSPRSGGYASEPIKAAIFSITTDGTTPYDQLEWESVGGPGYTEFNCFEGSQNPFPGLDQVRGMFDYNDSINLDLDKQVANNPEWTQGQDIRDEYRDRNCEVYNIRAGNLPGVCGGRGVLGDVNPQNPEELIYPVPGCAPGGPEFVSANNPVYAVQYRIDYQFPENLKAELSDRYRSVTQRDGVYDGVEMNFTYYTHREVIDVECVTDPCEPQLGEFLPWENPNQGNKYNGWLVYGYSDGLTDEVCEGELCDRAYTTVVENDMASIQVGYDKDIQTLAYIPTYTYMNGCQSAAFEYNKASRTFEVKYTTSPGFCTQATGERTLDPVIVPNVVFTDFALDNFDELFSVNVTYTQPTPRSGG